MKQVLAAVAAALGAAGCQFNVMAGPAIQGEGPVEKSKRTATTFHKIRAGNAMKLKVEAGSAPSVEVSAQQNLLKHIITKVDGDTLVIETDASISTQEAMQVSIVASSLESLELSGAATAQVSGFKGDSIRIECSGAADATVSGLYGIAELHGSGAAQVKLDIAGLTKLSIEGSGASQFELGSGALSEVKVELSGASSFRSKATAEKLDFRANGASKIEFGGGTSGTAQASGGSSIRFDSTVKSLSKDASGGSSIQP